MGGVWIETLKRMVLALSAAAVISEITAQLGGDEYRSTGLICGLCVAGCMLEAVKNMVGAM